MSFLLLLQTRRLSLREVTQIENADASVLTRRVTQELALLTTRLRFYGKHWETTSSWRGRISCLWKTVINQKSITKIIMVLCFSEELTFELIEEPNGVSLVRERWQLLGEYSRPEKKWHEQSPWGEKEHGLSRECYIKAKEQDIFYSGNHQMILGGSPRGRTE